MKKHKTLKTLLDGNVKPNQIYIFVANEEERKKYEENIPKEKYYKIVVGKVGITHQRRFIINYFQESQQVVSIDDDVEGVFKANGPKKLAQIRDIDTFYKEAFEQLHKDKLFIWGVYPVRNPFFMKPNITKNLKFILGTMYGFINRKSQKLQPSPQIKEKEDVEQSILYYLMDGGVLRYNYIAVKTKFHSDGGLGKKDGRFDANEHAAKFLAKKYPKYVTIFHRKNNMAEVRLHD